MTHSTDLAPDKAFPNTSLTALASGARSDRNRAIDFYRAIAMVLVALGHWMATAVGTDENGDFFAGNALEYAPDLAWLSWLFQVMPLFFVVGGFSTAMSLDSHNRNANARPQDWVIGRLRRMLAPAMTLARAWLILLVAGLAVGQTSLVVTGALAAAIPLWFLANYTIDTAIAPTVLPLYRRFPTGLPVVGVAAFLAVEAARFAAVPLIPHINWVIGWLLFQVAGFAWRDGRLPTGYKLGVVASGLWVIAYSAVAFGPWPAAMVHFPGLANSPTHPPTVALLLFGSAYSATAIAAAPAISAWLARSTRVWIAIVGANSVAMSVYLWHFTAIIAATAIFMPLGLLPNAAVNSTTWWIQKLPLMAFAAVILAGIIAAVSNVGRRALLAPKAPWKGSHRSLLGISAVLSIALKQWAHGTPEALVGSVVVLLGLWHWVLRAPEPTPVR